MIKHTQDENGNKIKYIGTLRTQQYSNGDVWDCHLYINTRRHNQDFVRFYVQLVENGIVNMPPDYQPKLLDDIPDIRKYQHKPQMVRVDTSKRVRRAICRDKQCTELHQQAQTHRERHKE